MFLSLVPHEWPGPDDLFSSTGSSLCRPRPCTDDLAGGGGGGNNAVLVEPAGEAGCSPYNTRAAARVAEPDVTMRTKSMATTTFLIVGDMEMANIISLLLVVAHSSSLVSLLT